MDITSLIRPWAELMHEQIKVEVEESITFAEASDQTPPEALYQDVTVAHHIPQE